MFSFWIMGVIPGDVMKVIRFDKNNKKELHVNYQKVEDYFLKSQEENDLKIQILENAKELLPDFISQMKLTHIDFQIDEDSTEDYYSCDFEKEMDSPIFLFALTGNDEEFEYTIRNYATVSVDRKEQIINIEHAIVAGKCNENNCFMFNTETLEWMRVSFEEYNGFTEKQQEILDGPLSPEQEVLETLLNHDYFITDDDFQKILSMNKALFKLYKNNFNLLKAVLIPEEFISFFDKNRLPSIQVEGEKQPLILGLRPRQNTVSGVLVLYVNGKFRLLQEIILPDGDENYHIIEKLVTSTKNAGDISKCLVFMLDHFEPVKTLVVPLSFRVHLKGEDYDHLNQTKILYGDKTTLNEKEKNEKKLLYSNIEQILNNIINNSK